MFDEALRQINKTILVESSEDSDSFYKQKDCGSDDVFMSSENISPKDIVDLQENNREWRSPHSSIDGRMDMSGYHTPAYLSPGITRKLQLTEDMELPFLAAQP